MKLSEELRRMAEEALHKGRADLLHDLAWCCLAEAMLLAADPEDSEELVEKKRHRIYNL